MQLILFPYHISSAAAPLLSNKETKNFQDFQSL